MKDIILTIREGKLMVGTTHIEFRRNEIARTLEEIDLMKIPAASTDSIDLETIQRRFPDVAIEIRRIGNALANGTDSAQDIIQLGKLLKVVGEDGRAEELLRCNVVDVNDPVHTAYIDLFGHKAEEALEREACEFADEFAVKLSIENKSQFLKWKCTSRPLKDQRISDERILQFLQQCAEIEFKYESSGSIADISSASPQLFSKWIILQHTNMGWRYLSGSAG